VDSKDVAKALKAEVFPVLRKAGFTHFKSRTAWRDSDSTIAVVDFRSMGSSLGSAVGVTSHYFGGGAGLYYKDLHSTPWATEPLPALPEEWCCQARRVLRKSIWQLWCRRPDVWYVKRSGSNLASVVDDVLRAVEEQALPWLNELGNPAVALEAFESRPESEMRRGIMLESLGGQLNSFARAERASALALARGDRDRARAAWTRMLANPYYKAPSDLRSLAEARVALL